ncbi:MAG TPA: hypothetical protein PKA27_08245, partial [Fimbriimonadaceae bacterium]|nr:hypothetical protein [Fimbriimonadaceae bacterium]
MRVKQILRRFAVLVGACLLGSVAWAGSDEFEINPKATYLRTQSDPSAENTVPIDLASLGIFPGDVIRLEKLGSFSSTTGLTGTQSGMAAVFSTSDVLTASTNLNRVSGAIEFGTDVSTPPTQVGNLSTNVSQDFSVTTLEFTVPINAAFLFVSGLDRFYGDNTDDDGDFKIRITKLVNGIIFTANEEIDEANNFFEDYNVVVSGCTVSITGTHQFYALTVVNSGVVTHRAGAEVGMDLSITNNVSVDSSSAITTLAKGYAARQGPGAGGSLVSQGGGGGYGGRGGWGNGTWPIGDSPSGGPCYGSVTEPMAVGSGGGGTNGGAGGGSINLLIGGTLQVDGVVASDGQGHLVNDGSGGGSGGSIWITASTLAGSGIIRANGGTGSYGGGGGGRIALVYTSDPSQIVVQAWGGVGNNGRPHGGAGTVLRKLPSQSIGTLRVANWAAGMFTEFTGINTFDSIEIGPNSYVGPAPLDTTFHLIATGDMTVEAGGLVIADARGFPARQGPGAGATSGSAGGGGGYGGRGGWGNGTWPIGSSPVGGPCYGSVTEPNAQGSGGGGTSAGAGGGVLRLTVGGTLTVSGIVTADGQGHLVNDGSGGGSGG